MCQACLATVGIEEGLANEQIMKKEFTGFYDRCLSYLDLWKESFGLAEDFVWLNSSALTWEKVEASALKINDRFGKELINIDELFDEVVLLHGMKKNGSLFLSTVRRK